MLERVDAEEIIVHKERNKKKHTISPFTGIYLIVIAIFIIVSLILGVNMSTRINAIYIKSDDIISANEKIKDACSYLCGESYLTFDKNNAARAIEAVSPLVAEVQFEGKYPRKLYISVKYDTPRYYATDSQEITYIMSSTLEVLHIYQPNEKFDASGLTKLSLPEFTVEKTGQIIKFATQASYVTDVTSILADYDGIGDISYISFDNTQRIYFIFNKNFKCELGDSSELELKLKSAENCYREYVFPSLGEGSQRTAIINVSSPASTTYRLDADLGITE